VKRVVLLVSLLAAVAAARVIVVPDSAATIGAGLTAAYSGDTVLVMPGTYLENLTWPSRDGISLLSSAGPESTTVDGQYAGTCLAMSSGSLTRATLVRGFTFADGYSAGGGAAGISCAGSASIVGNRVTRCNGVGIYLSSYSGSFAPLIEGNEVDGCFKEIENYNYGCGMYIEAATGARPEIVGNYIHHDTLRNSARNYGGGIYCDADALIYQNVIEANVLMSDTGSACRAYGAGIFVDMSRKPVIFSNLIKDNKCATDAWKYGAGIRTDLYAQPYIIGNTIVGNVCAGPHMWSEGGGIYNDIGCTTYVRNNIIASNQATTGPGIYNESGSGGVINSSHNDYYNNALYGCSYGPGDITQNPLFTSGPGGNYYLSQVAAGQTQNSPCLDAGDTLGMTVPLNLDSLFRTWTTRTDSIIDMDMLDVGFHYPGGIMLGVEEGRQLTANSRQLPTVVRGVLFLPRLGTRSELPERNSVMSRAVLLDAAGRRVLSLNPGANDVSRLAPGVYFVGEAQAQAAAKVIVQR
jgi:predicted outer membrane repeat protein